MVHKLNRRAFVPLSIKQKVSLVLAFWLVSLGLLYILSSNQHPHVIIDTAAALQSVSVKKNHLGRCWFGLSDPSDKHLLGTVSFESLETHGAKTGPFKTAALRAMEIQHLSIDLNDGPSILITTSAIEYPFQSSSEPTDNSTAIPLQAKDSNDASGLNAVKKAMEKFLAQNIKSNSSNNNDLMRMTLPDFSHLVHIRASDFQCRFLEGQNIVLHIQSKKASVQADNTDGLLLRGHVIIRTPAATLESNNILWDIQNKTFQTKGFYSIRTGNELEKGMNGLFGPQLNKITQQRTFAHKGEKPE